MKFESPFQEAGYVFPREDGDGYCIFFDRQDRRCLVHPVKPETCAAGPFTFGINGTTAKIEWFLKLDSVCPLAASLRNDREGLAGHLDSAKREIATLIHELDGRALRLILKIEEPETVKIGEDSIHPQVLRKALCDMESNRGPA